MTAQDAADMLGVSKAVITNAIRSGRLPGNKVGRTYMVMRKDLIEFMRGNVQ